MGKAGIAQLVEQATENRRVPSSNLGPGTIIKHLIGAFLMSFQRYNNDRLSIVNSRSDDSIVYIISVVLETIIGHFLWYGSGMEVKVQKIDIRW